MLIPFTDTEFKQVRWIKKPKDVFLETQIVLDNKHIRSFPYKESYYLRLKAWTITVCETKSLIIVDAYHTKPYDIARAFKVTKMAPIYWMKITLFLRDRKKKMWPFKSRRNGASFLKWITSAYDALQKLKEYDDYKNMFIAEGKSQKADAVWF